MTPHTSPSDLNPLRRWQAKENPMGYYQTKSNVHNGPLKTNVFTMYPYKSTMYPNHLHV